LYSGPVSGVRDEATVAAVVALQRRSEIAVDGIVGPQTRAALGRWARHLLGSRRLGPGNVGWDVAALQFELAWHGFPSGDFTGIYNIDVQAAVRRFQRWAALQPTGVADIATIVALRQPLAALPMTLAWPLAGAVTDGFGPRGDRFHTGLDIPAPLGTPVAAAASGRVTYATELAGGWGITVTIAHGDGVRTMYAHLSAVTVTVGQHVAVGQMIGRVGATGDATGPHLHFEARLRGAAVDPAPALDHSTR
jgi:murein DD-endopeptidase MepM/ murein hydrolase activator NlpD